MADQFSNLQQFRKPAVVSRGGIVAAQSRRAAEVGAEVLAAGGDCVDAVIATTFALGVLEPWMSGIGGGGAMVLYRASEDNYEVIDYGMCAPGSLRTEDYPLTGAGAASDLFPWPRVKDDRNLHGPGSVAVPGVVAGMEEAHRRHAKLPWKDLISPSVALAGEGLAIDWWTTLMIGSVAADLRRYQASTASYLLDGLPPHAPWGIKAKVQMPQDRLQATLTQLAASGPRDFYEGELARSIAADMKANGGSLTVDDLASFRAHLREPLPIPYRGGTVYATPELTAGPTLAHTLRVLQQNLQANGGEPDAEAYATDARQAAWFSVTDVPHLAFDHEGILAMALTRLKGKVRYQPIGFELLPPKFTLTQLQRLYEVVLETTLDKRNFRKKVLGLGVLEELDEIEQDVAHRAARLYRFDRQRYRELTKKGWNFEL